MIVGWIFFIGLESFNARILSLCDKRQEEGAYIQALENIQTYAPCSNVSSSIIVALPFQTYDEFKEDILHAFAVHDRFPFAHIGFVCLIPTSGTRIMNDLRDVGYTHKNAFEDIQVARNALAHAHKWCSWAATQPGKSALWYAPRLATSYCEKRDLASWTRLCKRYSKLLRHIASGMIFLRACK